MKNKAKLGQEQNCWKLHHPTGRTCLKTSATRTAPDDLVFTISAIWCPTREYDEGGQWHDVQASLIQKKMLDTIAYEDPKCLHHF